MSGNPLVGFADGWTAPGFVRLGPAAAIHDSSALAPNAGGWGDDDDEVAVPKRAGDDGEPPLAAGACYPIRSVPRVCDYARAPRPTTPTRRFDVAATFVKQIGDPASPRQQISDAGAAPPMLPPPQPTTAASLSRPTAPSMRAPPPQVHPPADRADATPPAASHAPPRLESSSASHDANARRPLSVQSVAGPPPPPPAISASALGAVRPERVGAYEPVMLAALFADLGIQNPPTVQRIASRVSVTVSLFGTTGRAGFGSGEVGAAIEEVEAAWVALLPPFELQRYGLKATIARAARSYVLGYAVGWWHWLEAAF